MNLLRGAFILSADIPVAAILPGPGSDIQP